MSFLVEEPSQQAIHPEPEALIKIITTQLSMLVSQGILKPQFSRYNKFKALLQLLEPSPIPENPFNRIDFHWSLLFYQEYLKIVAIISQSRSGCSHFAINSQMAKVDICSVIKRINQSNSMSKVTVGIQKHGYLLVYVIKTWNQYRLFHPSFRKRFQQDIKQIKNLLIKTVIRCKYHFCIPILNLEKFDKNNNSNMYQKLKQLKESFESFRSCRQKSSKIRNFKQIFQEDSNFMKIYYVTFCQIFLQTKKTESQNAKQNKTNQLESQYFIAKRQSSTISMNRISEKVDFLNYSNFLKQRIVNPIQIFHKRGNQIALDMSGQHSKLTKATYNISILFSINELSIQSFSKYRPPNSNSLKNSCQMHTAFDKQLICKRPIQNQCSKNSLSNQMDFLIFIRGSSCPSIATYFLSKKNPKKQIYIEPYPLSLSMALKMPLSINKKLSIIYQIVKGTLFLYERGVLHRDLKPGNILLQFENQQRLQSDLYNQINSNINPKIIDFGSCCPIYGKQDTFQVHEMRLLSTQKYHISFSQLQVQQIKCNFLPQQYNRHPFFDIYGIGQIIADLFAKQLQEYANYSTYKDSILTYVFYLVQRCKSQNPDDRLSHQQLLVFIDTMIKCSKQDSPNQKTVISRKSSYQKKDQQGSSDNKSEPQKSNSKKSIQNKAIIQVKTLF